MDGVAPAHIRGLSKHALPRRPINALHLFCYLWKYCADAKKMRRASGPAERLGIFHLISFAIKLFHVRTDKLNSVIVNLRNSTWVNATNIEWFFFLFSWTYIFFSYLLCVIAACFYRCRLVYLFISLTAIKLRKFVYGSRSAHGVTSLCHETCHN